MDRVMTEQDIQKHVAKGMLTLLQMRRSMRMSEREYQDNVAKLKGWEKARLEMLANAKK